MSTTDALTITSALDALTRYYDAKEREESAVLYINDAYLEALNSLEKMEAENAKLRELGGEVASILFNLDVDRCGLCQRDSISHPCPVHTVKGGECLIKSELRELGVEVQERYDMRDEWEDAIMAENAKLRELLRDTYDCICEMYKYMDGGYAYEDAEADPAYGPILKRMRELGVEAE